MKKIVKKLYGILLVIIIVLTPQTICKYTQTLVGSVGELVFSTLSFITDTFYIENDDLVENEDGSIIAKDDPKWGQESPAYKEEGLSQGMGSLSDVEFSVSNKSNKELLINFYIDFKINIVKNFGASQTIIIKNITTGQSVSGTVTFTKYDESGFLNGVKYYNATVNPLDFINKNNQNELDIIENSFVIYPENNEGLPTSAKYQVTIEFSKGFLDGVGDWLSENVYLSFYLIAVPYEG